MSLTTSDVIRPSTFSFLKQQVFYKARMHAGLMIGLIILQFLFIVFNVAFVEESVDFSLLNINIIVYVHKATNVIGVTLFWAFIAGFTLANRSSRDKMNVVITNNTSNHVSNGILLVFMSIVGGLTAFLVAILVRVTAVMIHGMESISFAELLFSSEMAIGIFATVLYMSFVMVIGYVTGCLAGIRRTTAFIAIGLFMLFVIFSVFIPGFIFGVQVLSIAEWLYAIKEFYTAEANIGLFSLKVVFTCLLLFTLAIAITNRQEAR